MAVLAAAMLVQHTLGAQVSTLPRYEADPSWPKPLPNRWVLGGLGGTCVDARDHVFILNRQDVPEAELTTARQAPAIIEFDPEGNVVNSWGDPALLDPRLHSCYVDRDTNIWIASAPSGMVQKYTHDGSKLLLQVGKKGVVDSSDGTVRGKPLNSNAAIFFMPSSIDVDRQTGEVYISDGEAGGGNLRIAVLDAKGAFVRQWQPQGMDVVHCMLIGKDGLVYVCNRNGSEVHVYDKMGSLKRKMAVPSSPTAAVKTGSAVAIAFSADQKWIFDINQNDNQIDIIDRESGTVVGNFGSGQFTQPHGIAIDARGNIFIAENRGRRILKFRLINPS
jgi:outer membrane protein assembly factor BamB